MQVYVFVCFPESAIAKLLSNTLTGKTRLKLCYRAMSTKATAAQLYLENSLLQKDHADQLMSMLSVPYGGLVLDLGCGTGHLATILSDLVGPEGQVVAVDPDAERIKVAKRENSRPNIQYSVANDQTFPGKSYDLIVSTHVIHWIKNKQALLNRLYSKLAPGGIFGFLTYDGTPEYPQIVSKGLSVLVSPNFEKNLKYTRMNFETKESYHTLANSAGFNVASAKVVHKELTFVSVDEFLEYWSGVSHGDFSVSDVDEMKLKIFKENHEKDLVSNPINLETLCFVVEKV